MLCIDYFLIKKPCIFARMQSFYLLIIVDMLGLPRRNKTKFQSTQSIDGKYAEHPVNTKLSVKQF